MVKLDCGVLLSHELEGKDGTDGLMDGTRFLYQGRKPERERQISSDSTDRSIQTFMKMN